MRASAIAWAVNALIFATAFCNKSATVGPPSLPRNIGATRVKLADISGPPGSPDDTPSAYCHHSALVGMT